MRRRLYQLAVIVASLFIINGLSRGLVELSGQQKRLERAQQELKKLERKQVELKQQLEYFRSDEYVETIARDKLLLAKPGETVLLLPESQTQNNQQLTIINQQSLGDPDLPNWQKWAQLFGFF